MSFAAQASRTQLWLESLGDWSWPGSGGAAVDFQPPSWVPAFPPRLEAATGVRSGAAQGRPSRAVPRRLGMGAILSALAAICVALTLQGPAGLERVVGLGEASSGARALDAAAPITPEPAAPPLPVLASFSHDGAGSSIDATSYS